MNRTKRRGMKLKIKQKVRTANVAQTNILGREANSVQSCDNGNISSIIIRGGSGGFLETRLRYTNGAVSHSTSHSIQSSEAM